MNICPLRLQGIRNPQAPGLNIECQGPACQWWIRDRLPHIMSTTYEEDCALVLFAKANTSLANQLLDFLNTAHAENHH